MFDLWWNEYPNKDGRKVNRKKTLEIFTKLFNEHKLPDIQVMQEALRWQKLLPSWQSKQEHKEGGFQPQPCTYLNGAYWENPMPDEYAKDYNPFAGE
jgi:hypothetical protein